MLESGSGVSCGIHATVQECNVATGFRQDVSREVICKKALFLVQGLEIHQCQPGNREVPDHQRSRWKTNPATKWLIATRRPEAANTAKALGADSGSPRYDCDIGIWRSGPCVKQLIPRKMLMER